MDLAAQYRDALALAKRMPDDIALAKVEHETSSLFSGWGNLEIVYRSLNPKGTLLRSHI